jgi:hypothetical protein
MEIAPRFNGPPDSGHGGYSAGALAESLGVNPAEVTLRAPVPLGRTLDVVIEPGEYAQLHDGDTLVAEARPVELDIDVPSPPAADVAVAAAKRSLYIDVDTHPFPTCFGCGPTRDEGDGLRIFPGPIEGRDHMFAATWTPPSDVAGPDGAVPSEFVWAALDCPTSAPVTNDLADADFLPIVLGRMTVRIDAPAVAGEQHVIATWRVAIDGRKRTAGAALYGPDGAVRAVARALWIELRPR